MDSPFKQLNHQPTEKIEAITRKTKFLDVKDVPEGAISVHGLSVVTGTVFAGLFSTEGRLLFGHGASLLISQIMSVVAMAAWAAGQGFILFLTLNRQLVCE